MHLTDALNVLAHARTDEVVISSMSAAREWPQISKHPLDFHYVPSTMGGAPALGLGIALAQPERHVISLVGDGSLLMNVGSLLTVLGSGASNLTLVVIDNGVYEVTGSQKTVGAVTRVSYSAVARAMGWENATSFDDLHSWESSVKKVLSGPGPRFIVLKVKPKADDFSLSPPGPMVERIREFAANLAEDE